MENYHHGDLRRALLEATDSLLAERGPQGFSLREVARRAGVTAAAPAHHFGSAAGLLTAAATSGFEAFAKALRKGDARGGGDPRRRLREQGIEYVRFAMRHPGRFRLMFSEALDSTDEALGRSGNDAFLVLEGGVRAAFGVAPGEPLSDAAWNALLALWSVVHGYAHLALAGRLTPCAEGQPLEKFVARTLPEVLEMVIAGTMPLARGDNQSY